MAIMGGKKKEIAGLFLVEALLALLCLIFPLSTMASATSLVGRPNSNSQQTTLSEGQVLWSVWGSSSADVFAVGGGGTILHYDGSTWSPMTSGTPNALLGIWGSSFSNVFAVGYGGTILHYDGSAWDLMTSGTTDYLWGVWGSSSSDVFAVGYGGIILHYNGSTWSPMTSGTTNLLYGVWGTSSSDVFTVGYRGIILHYNGSAWGLMASSTEENKKGLPLWIFFAIGIGTVIVIVTDIMLGRHLARERT